MSVHTPAPRPPRALPAATVGVLASLLALVVAVGILLVFVLAPLALLAVGLLALVATRPRVGTGAR